MSFRRRIVALVCLVTLVVMGGAFTGVGRLFVRSQLQRLDSALLSLAHEEATHLSSTGFTFSPEPGLDVDNTGPLLKHGAVYDDRGTVIALFHFDAAPPPPAALASSKLGKPFDFELRGEPLRGVVIAIPGHPSKRLLMAVTLRDMQGDEALIRQAMALAVLVAVVWVGGLVSYIVGRYTRGHRAIAEVARRVSDGDLSVRVGHAHQDPEVQPVAADIDHMVERLQVLVASQQQFIAHAAHELRSPLAVLYGELQLALRKPRSADEYREALQESLGSAQRLRDLAEGLLALARLGGADVGVPTRVALGPLIAHVTAQVSGLSEPGRVVFENHIAGDAETIAREGDLERLFRNLLENAARHTPKGGRVRVRSHADGTFIYLTVSDDGPGVKAEDRDRIFEPFYRAATTRAVIQDGAGLGLAISKEIVRVHRGDLSLVSPEKGDLNGACFRVALPSLESVERRSMA
jgi:two-component system heavy metal sensor histidine kinase CusS